MDLLSTLMSRDLVDEDDDILLILTVEGAEKRNEVLKLVDWLTLTSWWERA